MAINEIERNVSHPANLSRRNVDARPKPQTYHNPFLPILLIGCTVLAWTAFKTTDLQTQRHALNVVYRAQSAQLQSSRRLRAALNRLAIDVKRLSGTGDPGARIIVKQLEKRGITIHLHQQNSAFQE
jgi:hypothetical protein